MTKLLEYIKHLILMPLVENLFCHAMKVLVASIAQGDKILQRIVTFRLGVSNTFTVDMMNADGGFIPAMPAGEVVSPESLKVIGTSVPHDKFCGLGASVRAVELVGRSTFLCRSANGAGKTISAGLAMLLIVFLYRVKLASAFCARLCVKLQLGLFMFGLTSLASDLKFVVHAKLFAADVAASIGRGFFHKPMIARLEGV